MRLRLTTRHLLGLLASLAVTAAVLYLLLDRAMLDDLGTALGQARGAPLVAAFACAFAAQYLRAWRFALLVEGRRTAPQPAMLQIALRLNLFNYLLPFRLGELSFPIMVRERYGVSLLHGTGLLLVARLYDLCTVLALFCAAFAATPLAASLPGGATLAIVAAPLFLALPPLLLAASRRISALVRARWPGRPSLVAVADGLESLHRQRAGVAAMVTSTGIWACTALLSLACAAALPGAIGNAQAFLGAAAHSLAFVIPVHGVAGIGPAPAAWATAASAAGVDWVDAVAAALLLQAVALAAALLYGLPALLPGRGGRDTT